MSTPLIHGTGISTFLVANSCWRSGAYALSGTLNRRRETVPTNRTGSDLQPEPCSLNKRYPVICRVD